MRGRLDKWFDEKGYGFIETDDGRRVFVHNWDIYGTGPIRVKQRMDFEIRQTEKGPRAVSVDILE